MRPITLPDDYAETATGAGRYLYIEGHYDMSCGDCKGSEGAVPDADFVAFEQKRRPRTIGDAAATRKSNRYICAECRVERASAAQNKPARSALGVTIEPS